MNTEKIRLQQIITRLTAWLEKTKRYRVAAFVIFVVLIYGFVLLRIHSLSDAQPTNDQVTSKVQAARIPHVDQSIVQQLQTLQDNSVTVQALFNQARNNPFQ